MTTARECQWSATPDVAWLTIRGTASGQGEGSVEYAVAANPDPVTRRGVISLNNQRAEIAQAAAQCVIQLTEASASFTPAGGQGSVGVRASSALCTWTASADADWITIRSGASGSGNGSVGFDVAAAGAPRTGTISVANQRFSIIQSQGCTYIVEPVSQTVGPSGGPRTVSVGAAAGCPWTAASNAPWITVTQGTASSGPGIVTFIVGESSGPSRTGTLVVAGQTVTITQTAGCAFTVAPLTQSVPASGGTGTISVQAPEGCGWGARSNATWITVSGGASAFGNGTVTFTAAPTTGAARSGTIEVAGQIVTISQGQGCTYAIAPESQSIDPAGGTGSVAVTAGDGCGWTASSAVSWITITAGASGTGNGTVRFSVAATNGPSRSGALTIAGRTFTVTQGQGCAFALSSTSTTVPQAGGSGSFDVQTAGGCAWTATSNAAWISVTEGAAGTGNGTVRFTAAANTGPARSGTITAGGRTFTIDQAAGCSYTVNPAPPAHVSGGSTSFTSTVTTTSSCAWTASSNVPWMTIATGASGTGTGDVQIVVEVNTGSSRSGTLTIAGQAFSVTQNASCNYAVAPQTLTSPAAGSTNTVNVTASSGCSWAATSNAPWIAVTAGATGTGDGAVQVTVQATAGPARTGTLTVAGLPVTVNQDSGCTFALSAPGQTMPAAGGAGSVTVTTTDGCAWTATSNVPWIAITAGLSGTTTGAVQFAVEANATGAPRSGTLTIGGQTFTVSQE